MNISGYGVAGTISSYRIQNTSQTSSKSFTIPTLEQTQKSKVSSNVESPLIGTITYIGGYDKFDPFKEIAKTGSISFPDGMQTKTEPTRSDEEILKDMEELAREHARTGMSRKDDKRFAKLMDEYISSVSPDREGILKSKISEILVRIESEISGMEGLEDKEEYDMTDYLLEALRVKKKEEGNYNDIINNIINAILAQGNNIATSGNMYNNNIIATHSDGYYTEVIFDRGGGNTTSLAYDRNGNLRPGMVMAGDMYDGVGVKNGVVESANFYDSNGEQIMSYFSNSEFGNGGLKLMQKYTKAEGERMQEIVGAYNAAFDVAYGRQSNNTMDKAYNSTYDRLTNNAVA